MNEFEEKKLIEKAQNKDVLAMEQLIVSYKGLVSSIARQYFLLGGETADLEQEGMIGLFQAIQTYDPTNSASFKTFAMLCIKRKVQTLIKISNRQKNKMFHFYLTINNQGIIVNDTKEEEKEEEESDTGIYITSTILDPENAVISKETVAYIKEQIENKLSDLEKNVLQLYIVGESYTTIAHELKITRKTVDNILFKVRRKLAFLKEDEE